MSKTEPMVAHTAIREDGTTYEVQVPKRLIRRFKRLCTSMAALIEEFREHAPDGSLYLQEDSPHLLVGPSHLGTFGEPSCQKNILVTGKHWPWSGGGAW